jgi:hypothetical protein
MTRVMVHRGWGMAFGKLMLEKKRYVTIHMMLSYSMLSVFTTTVKHFAILMMSLMNKTYDLIDDLLLIMLTKDDGSSEDEWMEMGDDDDENSTEVGGDFHEDYDEEASNSGTLNDKS